MKEISLTDALRYLFTGLVPLGFLYICDSTSAKTIVIDLGPIGASFLAIAWGSITYHLYRSLVYQHIIAPLQDLMRKNSYSPRTYLAEKYNISRYQATILWANISNEVFREHVPSWRREASGIHLMYISAITAFGFALWQAIQGTKQHAILMLFLGILIAIGGFFHDRLSEDYEVFSCRSLDDEKIGNLAKKFGLDRPINKQLKNTSLNK